MLCFVFAVAVAAAAAGGVVVVVVFTAGGAVAGRVRRRMIRAIVSADKPCWMFRSLQIAGLGMKTNWYLTAAAPGVPQSSPVAAGCVTLHPLSLTRPSRDNATLNSFSSRDLTGGP